MRDHEFFERLATVEDAWHVDTERESEVGSIAEDTIDDHRVRPPSVFSDAFFDHAEWPDEELTEISPNDVILIG